MILYYEKRLILYFFIFFLFSATALSLRPSVLMQMKLTDNTTQQFEMNIFRFHQLRYYVAKTLKDMQDIEQLAILKID